MPWLETSSPSFLVRHDSADSGDAVAVLELLEGTRERLAPAFGLPASEIAVVLHRRRLELALAQPYLPLLRRLTGPAGRRYLVGWCGPSEIHMLAPRTLAGRASAVAGSREMLMLAPAALYAQIALAESNPFMRAPVGPRGLARYIRWAWLVSGASQYFSGQTSYARPAIARRLHDGRQPSFPPGVYDAQLLGGAIFDLLAREQGELAAVRLAREPPTSGPRHALLQAFGGRDLTHTSGRWRAHLARLAEP